jgi:PTS system fructose-specific IIC component
MKLVAITSCSTGIAHTYMAAEKLMMEAKAMGHEIKVETQGSIGAENVLAAEDIAAADAVLIASNTGVNKERFHGKRLYETNVEDGINKAGEIIEKALASTYTYKNTEAVTDTNAAQNSKQKVSVYKHLMAGVSYMIPFVVAGGICIALSFAFGGIHSEGAIAQAFSMIGGGVCMALMFPILGGFIGHSISDRPGLLPGMVGGMLASTLNAGFLGALIGGFLGGYAALFLKKTIKMPKGLEGLMPVLIVPFLSSVIVGLTMIFIIGTPFKALNTWITEFLNSLSGVNSALLGLILGAMMAVDLAGPIGKAAYFFGVASLTTLSPGETAPVMAAVMASGMVPPLAMALSTIIAKDRYTTDQIESGKTAWILGASFISEGAIPFAAADPVRVLPSVTIGAAVTGALSMIFNCGLAVPHGGAFVFVIPGAVSNLPLYLVAIIVGTIISGVLVSFLKKR